MPSLRSLWDVAIGSAVCYYPIALNMRVGQTLAYSFTGLMAVVAAAVRDGAVSTSLRVMSFNVRFDSMPDNITVQETIASMSKALPNSPSPYYADTREKPWSTRRIHVANHILSQDVDVYGGQELLRRQVLDLQELLGDQWAWVGIGRNDGARKGEYTPIFYNRLSVQLKDWDTFWLTETPFTPSKYPDAGSYRIANTAHFASAGGSFTLINTHLDDQSEAARALGASLILHRAKYEVIKTKKPVILTGDFNVNSTDSAYKIITGQMQPQTLPENFTQTFSWTPEEGQQFEGFALKDLLGEAPPQKRSGNYATFTGFSTIGKTSKFQRIDYIFGASSSGLTVESYHVGNNLRDDGVYSSDHRPVDAVIKLDGQSLTQQ